MTKQQHSLCRSQAFEASEDEARNDSANETLGDVIAARLNRRDLVKGTLAATALKASLPAAALFAAGPLGAKAAGNTPSFDFTELAVGGDHTHHVADGYDADILIRWGDQVLAGAPAFDPAGQSASKQARQFGYNNDYVGFIALGGSSKHGLLVVNHEYTNEELMFPAYGEQESAPGEPSKTRQQVDIEMMAHGGTVLEVKMSGGKWRVVEGSKYARRITAETPMQITGPAAGHERMRASYDPVGRVVHGMLNNCAGATTPWGTWLTCEENFNGYFWGKEHRKQHSEAKALRRYGVPAAWYSWGRHHKRFDIKAEPNEPNRFGWVVEIDPFDPGSMPKKRTALGRFKHEGAGNIVNGDGRFVVYQGDDQRFEYVYKFVTEGRVDESNRAANMDLLDRGTLYVARFDADGTGRWLPLVHGLGPLSEANGFASQSDVVIGARQAADLLGATKMDRPEDVDVNPRTGKVYVMLTSNYKRKPSDVDAANPRGRNPFGHIIELAPVGGDHAADKFTWEILVKCGDPSKGKVGASFNPATSKDGWFAAPDNCAVDSSGRLWIATDGNSKGYTGRADGVWAMETEGAARGTSKCFFQVPYGAELCGPEFTPDLETFFVAVQHPGVSSGGRRTPAATFEKPTTRWPDFKPGMPPRPSILAITKKGGGKIGG